MADEDFFFQSDDDLINGEDDVMLDYLKRMIEKGNPWPDYFNPDVDVFNKNPGEEFDCTYPCFVYVNSRTETCGKTDGCESGCWRVIGRDKLIRSEDLNEIIGFKKILKFCRKKKPREYKRSWVMEEYRLRKKWNWKEDKVICKIRLMCESEISFWLAKPFTYRCIESKIAAFNVFPVKKTLPEYGFSFSDPEEEDKFYLQTIIGSDGKSWPDYITNDVYRLDPLELVDVRDRMFISNGICIFANRTDASGETDECDDGSCWRIKENTPTKSTSLGFKRTYQFSEKEKKRYVNHEGEELQVTWTMEEYRVAEEGKQNKVLCVIKLRSYLTHILDPV